MKFQAHESPQNKSISLIFECVWDITPLHEARFRNENCLHCNRGKDDGDDDDDVDDDEEEEEEEEEDDEWVLVYSQSTTRLSQAVRPSARPGRRWRGSNPPQKGPCRSQGGFASHCATETPVEDDGDNEDDDDDDEEDGYKDNEEEGEVYEEEGVVVKENYDYALKVYQGLLKPTEIKAARKQRQTTSECRVGAPTAAIRPASEGSLQFRAGSLSTEPPTPSPSSEQDSYPRENDVSTVKNLIVCHLLTNISSSS
ncbi:hypothetical protein PoB_005912500 [Plakobranchus ocellatus]|uniref:Uncharacterized protein n=1 Tax=Plakobranchus ocellatus TaxID=259542 RepID=A0AAV4CID8_9GAST|nr:hypothetical protein PoB_005912500 [Plakobranchus ocellatus]